MAHATFDTLQFTETLKAAGIPEHQARAEVQAISLAFSQVIEKQVATKTDIASVKEELSTVREDLKEDISAVKEELKEDISAVKEELKEDISAVREELKEDISAVREELCTVREDLKGEIYAVKEELKGDVHAVREDIQRLTGRMNLIHWMLGFNLILTMGILWKLFVPA